MWKCFNRGVWETIDRSVNVFKADTSNGTCLISSLAKDLDGISEKPIRSKPQSCSEDKFGVCHVSEESNLLCEHKARRQIANRRPVKIHEHARTSKPFSRDLRHFRAVTASPIFDKSPTPSITEEVNVSPYKGRHQPPGIVNSSLGRTISGKCELECTSHASDCISESQILDGCRRLQLDEASEANIKWKLNSHSSSKSTKSLDFPEERRELNSPSKKLHESYAPKGRFFSLVSKIALLRDGRDVKEEKIVSSNEKTQRCDLVHSNSQAKSNCMLKLPFLCHDLGKLKGLNKVSAYWSMKPRSEFGRGNSGGTGGEQSGESEETKEDEWRECQMHQSLLEAIGWSSAVLFGWFLGQFRFWHIHREVRNIDSENKKKCCILGSLAKLLVTWRGDTKLPLKVLPSKTDGISKQYRKKKSSKKHGSENALINESYNEFQPDPFPVLESEEINLCDRQSSRNYFILQKTEDISCHKGHLNQKVSSGNEAQKSSVIPMPWHADSVKNLIFGPITLEEAIKEAGKGLEEAQAEVLLTLALEKLNEGCSSTQNEPLPAHLLQTAASLGSAAAAFNLGICYEEGVGGVVKNLVQAFNWYKLASEQGHAAATYNLAVFHANGLSGLHPNTFLAKQLLQKASALGLEEATNALGLISSFDSSEIFHNNEEYSSLRNNASLGHGDKESSNSPSMSKSHFSEGIKNKQDPMSRCSESYHGRSNDLSISLMSVGAVSQPTEYFKETSKVSSLNIGHLLLSHSIALNKSVDTGRPFQGEMIFDDHPCIMNSGIDSSVQLLAH